MSPRPVPAITANSVYLSSRQVRERFGGRGPLWIPRAIKSKGFPKPVTFAGGRLYYWRKEEIEAWERDHAERAA
jgi:predicted DNA-binding transcriptional regulator AlpA